MSIKQPSSKQAPDGTPAIVLAAGKGARMNADGPKAALHVGGRAMASRVIE
ncbi:MAG: NTP transferase domain-containing protein, partial [Proteobacteria bacterium]|nr:NTP transferase domain-containing protein [Pseudomonadota bacterium]